LNALYPGKEIDLRIERKAEDYVPPKPKPFSGQGHRLGSHVPNVAGAGNSSAAATGVDIVDLEPTPPLKPPSGFFRDYIFKINFIIRFIGGRGPKECAIE
jgi:hypothetical protein